MNQRTLSVQLPLALVAAICSFSIHAQTRQIELDTDEGLLTIPLADAPNLQVLPNGNIAATAQQGFICQQGESCSDVQVSLSSNDGGLFSLSESTVTQGLDFQISWSARGAWSCSGSGLSGTSWNGNNPKQPRGTQTISSTDLTVGSHQVEILCENGPQTASGALTLNIEEPVGDIAGCDGVPSLSNYQGWSRTDDASYEFGDPEPQTVSEIFTPWPGNGFSRLIGIPKGEYLAAAFNSDALTASSGGRLSSEDVQGAGSSLVGADRFIISISQCPGDFDPDSTAVADGCISGMLPSLSTFQWGGPGSGANCELEANTDYYLNIVFTDTAVGALPPTQNDCAGEGRCGVNTRLRGEL